MIDLVPASNEARIAVLAALAFISGGCVVWFAALLISDYRKAQREEAGD